jgi:Protein of unknown function (DUF3626)
VTSPPLPAIEVVTARSTGGWLDPGVRVTLNFHPDRALNGVPILVSLGTDAVYRSQFETGTSNGGLTAHPGGDRWRWESNIFGGAYDGASPRDRPKYGALNFRGYPAGAARRFGSAHFRLARTPWNARRSATPTASSTPCTSAWSRECRCWSWHWPMIRICSTTTSRRTPRPGGAGAGRRGAGPGPVLSWHRRRGAGQGAGLSGRVARRFPARGRRAVAAPGLPRAGARALGLELARDGHLDARIIGEASATGRHHPQSLKQVWHLVARFGR